MGHWALGMGHREEATNALCTWGWSFPSLSIKAITYDGCDDSSK
ncbi:hypothetical protein [aff. Roholtiella sp. LEGE 12411]|nr:hypothetical protein [aff. Roholtiella sp. LEGE 12411]